jgi:hypothetical protein
MTTGCTETVTHPLVRCVRSAHGTVAASADVAAWSMTAEEQRGTLVELARVESDLAPQTLDDGTRISASEARRLACEAGVIPLVLGGDSQPLDVGRRRRPHTEHQRIVLAQRDGGCKAETCDRPPAWSECHHVRPWSAGGVTSVGNGEMFCSFHRHLMHDRCYDKSRLPSGRVRFRLRQ